jgi:hypothetical protein
MTSRRNGLWFYCWASRGRQFWQHTNCWRCPWHLRKCQANPKFFLYYLPANYKFISYSIKCFHPNSPSPKRNTDAFIGRIMRYSINPYHDPYWSFNSLGSLIFCHRDSAVAKSRISLGFSLTRAETFVQMQAVSNLSIGSSFVILCFVIIAF